MSTEKLNPSVQELEQDVRNFANSRSDDYFTKIPPHIMEIMIGIAVDALLIPENKLTEEALRVDRDLARAYETLNATPDSTTILEASSIEVGFKRLGRREQETIDRLVYNILRGGIAEKRAHIAVLNGFQTVPNPEPVGIDSRTAPRDFCYQAVDNAIRLLR
ncbi:MAG: hypothetical protein Q7R49_02475 [Candidatus Daviesbacteria bacterium]|nr:hypothetical protein [Candidatus Daviesbacteria bacterium]